MNGLSAAIFSRWNASGLNTSIATLYTAGDKPGFNKSGSPEGTQLPRAEYFVISPATSLKTRNSRTNMVAVYIQVYGKGSALVQGWVDLVRSKYINAESSLSIASGTALEIDDGGSFCAKLDDEVWMGQQLLFVNLRTSNISS